MGPWHYVGGDVSEDRDGETPGAFVHVAAGISMVKLQPSWGPVGACIRGYRYEANRAEVYRGRHQRLYS